MAELAHTIQAGLPPLTIMPRPARPAEHAAAAARRATVVSILRLIPAGAMAITAVTRRPDRAMLAARAAVEEVALAVEEVVQAQAKGMANMAVAMAGAQGHSRLRGRRRGLAPVRDPGERLTQCKGAL